MSKTFVYEDSATATITVSRQGDAVLDGKCFKNGELVIDWDHEDFDSPIEIDIEHPNRYQILVFAMFGGEEATVDVTCGLDGKQKTCSLIGDGEDDGEDYLQARFRIRP